MIRCRWRRRWRARKGRARYSEEVLTNSTGFNGADGVFRFKPDGGNERGLSVVQINNGSTVVVSPAPRSLVRAPDLGLTPPNWLSPPFRLIFR